MVKYYRITHFFLPKTFSQLKSTDKRLFVFLIPCSKLLRDCDFFSKPVKYLNISKKNQFCYFIQEQLWLLN